MYLACEQLFSRACLSRDQHIDICASNLLHAVEDLLQAGTAPDDVTEALRLELPGHSIAIGRKLIEQDRVLQDQRCLPREHREQLQARLLEQVDDVVIAYVNQSEELPLRDEGCDHHRAQLQIENALARVEHRVISLLPHAQLLARVDALSQDAVGELRDGIRDRLAVDVARRRDLGVTITQQDHEALVRMHHFDDGIEKCLDLLRDGTNLE